MFSKLSGRGEKRIEMGEGRGGRHIGKSSQHLLWMVPKREQVQKASILLNTLTRARAVKHEEGGVLLLSPEPNPIMLATILMQMTTLLQGNYQRFFFLDTVT